MFGSVFCFLSSCLGFWLGLGLLSGSVFCFWLGLGLSSCPGFWLGLGLSTSLSVWLGLGLSLAWGFCGLLEGGRCSIWSRFSFFGLGNLRLSSSSTSTSSNSSSTQEIPQAPRFPRRCHLKGGSTGSAMDEFEMDFSLKKKKKKKPDRFKQDRAVQASGPEEAEVDHTYEFLLARAFENNPAAAPKATFPVPHVSTAGRRSCWTNFHAFCATCNRPPQHVMEFVQSELCCLSSVSSQGALNLKNKSGAGQLQQICRAYVNQHVLCSTCKSADTLLTRESRLSFVNCQACGSRRAVRQVRPAFVARTHREADP